MWGTTNELIEISNKMTSLSLDQVTPKERYSLVVKNRLVRSINELCIREFSGSKFSKCRNCFLVKNPYCICPDLQKLSSKVSEINIYPEIRFCILMNDRELFKSSNTGKLIKMLIPNSEILIHGLPEDEERLLKFVSSNIRKHNETIVLFPDNKLSVNLEACLENFYRRYVGEHGKNSCVSNRDDYSNSVRSGNNGNDDDRSKFDRQKYYKNLCLKVILIDGTWSQAKSINKFIPSSIPRVIIMSKKISDFGPLRKQNKEGNISTIEAASLLLIDIKNYIKSINTGDELNYMNFGAVADLFNESLNILITNVISQCKREYLIEMLNERNKKKFQK